MHHFSHYLTDIKVWGHWLYLIRLIRFFFSWVTAPQQSDILSTMTSEVGKRSLKAEVSCECLAVQTILVVIGDKNWVVCHPQIMPKYRYVCAVFQLYFLILLLAFVAANWKISSKYASREWYGPPPGWVWPCKININILYMKEFHTMLISLLLPKHLLTRSTSLDCCCQHWRWKKQ